MTRDYPLRLRTEVAEALSQYLTDLQADYGLTFAQAVAAIRGGLDNAHTDSDFPGGGYIVIS